MIFCLQLTIGVKKTNLWRRSNRKCEENREIQDEKLFKLYIQHNHEHVKDKILRMNVANKLKAKLENNKILNI